ncbi:hypothetical protein NEOLI_001524 [Neolecta irregularis DAH-3]|uniref:Uncharacterized protein n=1 Tax=Neolecta irregularis (strain DAH-3) TaxID=1198029 RepID=A0A1U7LLJ3_NEOID|nr:hypothetical protein NEOLI_001524 [Neolecta irregularis DAH-3]|eukprot:OLL23536.1 hypothetical protein NEOLI_001524 [Neolecta irregularis DAH-3]
MAKVPAVRYCLGNSAVRFLDVIVEKDVAKIYRTNKWIPVIQNTEKVQPVMVDAHLNLRKLWQEFQEFRHSEVIRSENLNLIIVFLAVLLNNPYSNRIGLWEINQDPWEAMFPSEDPIYMSWMQSERKVQLLKSGRFAIREISRPLDRPPILSLYLSQSQNFVRDKFEVVDVLKKTFEYDDLDDNAAPSMLPDLDKAEDLVLAFYNIVQGTELERQENWDPNLIQILIDYLHTVMLLNFGGNQESWVGFKRMNHETMFTDVEFGVESASSYIDEYPAVRDAEPVS